MNKPPNIDVLLVEDSPDHIELASRVFQKLGSALRVHIVQDGEEALDFLWGRGAYQNQIPESLKLVILDLYLPKVPGTEVLRQIRLHPRTRSLPVAILTITGNERSTLEQEPFHVKHYLRKPLELNDFLKLYETYIKGKNDGSGGQTLPDQDLKRIA